VTESSAPVGDHTVTPRNLAPPPPRESPVPAARVARFLCASRPFPTRESPASAPNRLGDRRETHGSALLRADTRIWDRSRRRIGSVIAVRTPDPPSQGRIRESRNDQAGVSVLSPAAACTTSSSRADPLREHRLHVRRGAT
jgi:hypothetical protein